MAVAVEEVMESLEVGSGVREMAAKVVAVEEVEVESLGVGVVVVHGPELCFLKIFPETKGWWDLRPCHQRQDCFDQGYYFHSTCRSRLWLPCLLQGRLPLCRRERGRRRRLCRCRS